MTAHFSETDYGFEYGAAKVTRIHSDKGRVWLGIDTPRESIQIYVTKTGLIRTSQIKLGRKGD